MPLLLAGAAVLLAHGARAQTLEDTAQGLGGWTINGHPTNVPYRSAYFLAGRQLHGVGDMNGDRVGDVLISAALERDYPACSSGERFRSYVALGGDFGPGPADGVGLGQLVASGAGVVIDGGCETSYYDAMDLAGASLGDFNGDGFADLAVGSMNDGTSTWPWINNPKVFPLAVILGGPSLGATGAVSHTNIAAGSGGFFVDAAGLANFPRLVASGAGDFNGDGLADMVLGQPRYRPAGQASTGRVFVVFGRTGTTRIQLSDIEQSTGGFVVRDLTPNTNFGGSVAAAGDVNGDGLADIAIGARFSQVDDLRPGKAYVLFGRTAPVAPGELSASNLADGAHGFVVKGEQEDDWFGTCVSGVGDINRDGYGDLAIGASGYDQPPQTNALDDIGSRERGAVYVAFGGPGPWPATGLDASALRQGTGGVAFDGDAKVSMTGTRFEPVGDWNADGYADLIVSAWNYRKASGPILGWPSPADWPDGMRGRTFVVGGRPGPVFPDPRQWLLEPDDSLVWQYLNGEFDPHQFPESAVAGVGDVNGDGSPDIAVSLPLVDCTWCPPPPPNVFDYYGRVGRVFLLWGESALGLTSTYTARVRAGNAPAWGIGSPPHAHDPSSWADSRAWLDFDAGHGPAGVGQASSTSVTITRHDGGLAGLPTHRTANVQWMVTTERVGYSQCRLTLRYTDAEIEGLHEAGFVLMTAPTSAGPFVSLAGSTVHASRNEISGEITTLPAVFAIVQTTRNGDANDDQTIDVADLTAIHNVLQGIVPPPLAGDGDIDNDGDIDATDAAMLATHLVNSTPLP